MLFIFRESQIVGKKKRRIVGLFFLKIDHYVETDNN